MARQVGHQIFHHTNRADTWAATAVGNAECFVQIEVAHIATKLTRRSHAHQGIHVGTVYIHAATMLMHQLAQGFDLRFKHAMRAGVGDHHGGQVGAVLFTLGLQIRHVNVALRVASCHHHLHASHLRAGRVGAVSTGGNQANVAMALAFGFVESFDHQQTCVFTLRARIGLQADAGIACGLAQPLTQLRI